MYLDINSLDTAEMGKHEIFNAKPHSDRVAANIARMEDALDQIARGQRKPEDRPHSSPDS